ncbi:oxaloacetate decarboxylase [Tianweitania sp. BSSL-BM11]|uniref:Oxaloacetate decarboxylase n=1 Tax=Tianweitania aestuarii TaxID=2814886 RepID=A0ABS5RZS9_9HYPH|nr:oxaloacetate decarboxylase [Tianweitania aestuarii]MBS9721801.1 oxaloacetate decarboxylase [Tianweitania aestuarii]
MKRNQKLRSLIARRDAVTVPGAANAMFARVIEDLGFEAVYVTGAGIANMRLGAPDVGLTTVTEVADTVAAISDAVDLPLIVDADTGFGNAVNTVRTIRLLERAGASAIQLEDQVFPKKCGHFNGKDVIPASEMLQKIKAAVDTRTDQDLLIIARTDARAIEGLDAALDRAAAYIEAGADMTFVEAPASLEELRRIGTELVVPQVANIVFGGKTPDPGRKALAENGFSIVLYANAALQAALRASTQVLSALRDEGSLDGVADLLAGFDERQRSVNKDYWDGLEAKYKQAL